jgi:hypothetical protein
MKKFFSRFDRQFSAKQPSRRQSPQPLGWLAGWRYGHISLAVMTALLSFGPMAIGQAASSPKGRFRVEYGPVKDARYADLRAAMRDSGLYESMAAALNKQFVLPKDLTITPSTCGEPNAFYQPSTRRLIMCDELLVHFAELFAPTADSEQELGESIVYANLFVFFHELGHGLIDVYDLPTVGREEDAVDEFSTLLLLEAGDFGEKSVLTAAQWFALQSEKSNGDLAFWDEHSLDLQRFYGISCLVYGKDPEKFSGLVASGILPESRADRCPTEYSKKSRSWEALLTPFSR